MIPGSMATPGYVVRGKGEPQSLDSASHGAGRCLSRRAAKDRYRWNASAMTWPRKGCGFFPQARMKRLEPTRTFTKSWRRSLIWWRW